MIYGMIIWVTKITYQGWSELKSCKWDLPLPWRNNISPLNNASWQWETDKQEEIICCEEITISMHFPGCSSISIYPLAPAVLIFFYAWSALDMSRILAGLGSLVQTEDTQSAVLSLQCQWLVQLIHTVESSAEGTISLYSSISIISTPSPICSFA